MYLVFLLLVYIFQLINPDFIVNYLPADEAVAIIGGMFITLLAIDVACMSLSI